MRGDMGTATAQKAPHDEELKKNEHDVVQESICICLTVNVVDFEEISYFLRVPLLREVWHCLKELCCWNCPRLVLVEYREGSLDKEFLEKSLKI